MADLLERASAWFDGVRAEHLSLAGPVLYVRGEASAQVRASVGRTTFEAADEHGVVEHIESRDFLVPAEDLVLDGLPTLPRRGDILRETDDATVHVYEVLAPGNEPPWRWSDDYRRTLRIHTKRVGEEAA